MVSAGTKTYYNKKDAQPAAVKVENFGALLWPLWWWGFGRGMGGFKWVNGSREAVSISISFINIASAWNSAMQGSARGAHVAFFGMKAWRRV